MNGFKQGNERKVSLLGRPAPPAPSSDMLGLHHLHPATLHLLMAQQVHTLPQTPSMSSSISGSTPLQLHSWFPSLPQESLWEAYWVEIQVRSSLSLLTPPCTHSNTHTHAHGAHLAFHRQTRTPQEHRLWGTIWLYFKILNSWSFMSKLFPKGVYAGLCSGASAYPHKSGPWMALPLSPRTSDVTRVPDSLSEWLWTAGWHHTWPSTRLLMWHSTGLILRSGKYRLHASRMKWLRFLLLGIRQIELKWVLIIPPDCISRTISPK